MEVFGARPAPAVAESLAEVAKSDLFVGLYAHRYGSLCPGTDVSITEREYEGALTKGMPVFAFLVADDLPWPPKFVEEGPGRRRLLDLKERLRREHIVDSFQSPDDLATKVATSVGRHLIAEASMRIPVPSSSDDVGVANIALLHTSFFSPDGTARFADGREYYPFEVIVIAPPPVAQRITSVTYHLEEAWPEANRTQVTSDRASRFKMKELANGTSIVTAEVAIAGQEEPLTLNRFIDLRRDGPRL